MSEEKTGWLKRQAEQIKKDKARYLDDHLFDCTDYAHLAWWRGHEHTAKVMCQLINEILDGKPESGGISAEPWESTKKRLYALAANVCATR